MLDSGKKSKIRRAIFALILLFALVSDANTRDIIKSIRIGVLAKRGPEHCMEKWEATAVYLTNSIKGYSFTIVPLDYDEIYPAVRQGEVDFILANPSYYVGVEHLYGASRIVTLKNVHMGRVYTVYCGLIICRAERNDIELLEDLKGKTFMAVEERSFGGWLAAFRELKEKGIDPYSDFADLQFGGTHDAVVYAVRDGKVDAGTVRTDTLERMYREGKIRIDEFKITHDHGGRWHVPFLHSTRPYPEWPLAKVRLTTDELAERVAVALVKMSPNSAAAKAARCAGWTIPHNYRPVRACLKELRVVPYEDFGKVTLKDMLIQHWFWFLGILILLLMISLVAVYVTRLNRRLQRAMEGQNRELAERKQVEDALEASLHEKEVLLKEVHHRVKNNFQIITSLINLQQGSIKDEGSIRILRDVQTRVRTMSLIHEKLYQSKDIANIDFADYIKKISNELYRMYISDPDRIVLNCDVESIQLNIEQAIPCGLVLNEILTNAFKYAFPKDREERGEVGISLHQRDDNIIELSISDNGVGIPENIDFNRTESLGLQLVHTLSEDQLKGEVKLDRHGGTKFTLSFKGN